jgi:hypothetical protein
MQLPRNVSPVSASFFGLQRLGIHRVLCVACSLSTSTYLRCYVRGTRGLESPRVRGVRFGGSAPLARGDPAMINDVSLLCFSLALGKIEVILFNCSGTCGADAPTTEEWKPVQSNLPPCPCGTVRDAQRPSSDRPVRPGMDMVAHVMYP